jgi:hypothetical protein
MTTYSVSHHLYPNNILYTFDIEDSNLSESDKDNNIERIVSDKLGKFYDVCESCGCNNYTIYNVTDGYTVN